MQSASNLGALAENTAVLAGDFKINFGQFPGPSFLPRPGPVFCGPCSCPHHSQALERPMIHARVITSTLFGEGTSWSWVVVGLDQAGPGSVYRTLTVEGSWIVWIPAMASGTSTFVAWAKSALLLLRVCDTTCWHVCHLRLPLVLQVASLSGRDRSRWCGVTLTRHTW